MYEPTWISLHCPDLVDFDLGEKRKNILVLACGETTGAD